MMGAFVELPHPGRPKDDRPVGYVIQENGCWDWVATPRKTGYAYVCYRNMEVTAHKYLYELLRGPVPPGLILDHLCRNRRCVNPDHLEPVTPHENTLRGSCPAAVNAKRTHCDNGHRLGQGNVHPYAQQKGHRTCMECARVRARQRYQGTAAA